MCYKNKIIFLLSTLLIAVLLVGCSVPFMGDDKKAEQTDASASKEKEKQAANVPIAEPDKKKTDQEEVAQEEVKKGPKLIVNLPPNMTTDYEKLKVTGSTTAGSTVFVNGQTVRLKSDGTFSSEITLNPGNNKVEVIAVDKDENTVQVSRTVKFAAGKPSLSVFAPSESSTATVTISGHTDPGCIVYLDNSKVKPDNNGSFSGTVKIKNRGNNTVKITAINTYGESTSTSKSIRGVPPKIQVAAPELTTNDQTTITGVADANTSIVLLVGSEQVSVNNNDGTFNVSIELEPGLNDVTVLATNLFGTTEVPLTILYDDYGKE